MGLGCFGKEIRQDRIYTCREERQTEGLVLLLRQMNTCGASYWSESADRTLEAERKWTISMWDFLYREVLGNARNKHSQEGRWLRLSPSEGH